MCNKEIKFKMFLNEAIDLGFDYIAMGHYASIKEENNLFHLLK
jgi:tRNA-specific 2-thiouridylase